MLYNEEAWKKHLEDIWKSSHKPTLLSLIKKDGKLFIRSSNKEIKKYNLVKKTFYVEEYNFNPIKEKSRKEEVKLSDEEIDTKILRKEHPNLNFNAYCWDYGPGFNIDGLTRIEIELYRI